MISDKQRQIIQLLLSKKEGYNVNQIARILNISVSWTHETLKILEKEAILKSEKFGNSILFSLNFNNPKTEKVVELIALDKDYKPTPEKQPAQKQAKNPYYTIAKPEQPTTEANATRYRSAGEAPVQLPSKYSNDKNTFAYNTTNTSYNVAPVGIQGVNAVLNSYAASGAFGGYSNNAPQKGWYGGSATPVPPSTLGSKISSNVSNFSLSMHTSQHKAVTAGCSYCSGAPSQFIE
ncbi:MAG TPA: winged helix-turn-helix domain-containing protein [Candidatus Nanoarchaeia archaeon]|nr:winged helix-turn-helix domain-containing protein [Candidatus Nanoarchaeia archaeon]